MFEPDKVEGVVLISEPSLNALNPRQEIAYKNHRSDLAEFLAYNGKTEGSGGYALDTRKVYASILDDFYRWNWETQGDFTLKPTHDDAEAFLKDKKGDSVDNPDVSVSYFDNIKLALKALFRHLDESEPFETDITAGSSPSNALNPRDFLTRDEREAVRKASLEVGTVPRSSSLSPDERKEWKKYLSRRFGKPADEIGKEDWDRANGFKYPSMVYTALDTGLRPVEVGRARVSWVNLEQECLQIPASQSSKNTNNWTVALTDETMDYLELWLQERELYPKYEDSDRLWLTRHGNPYSSSGLRPLLENLADESGIERKLTWYSIRHSVGTLMTREEDLAAAQAQLRHNSKETTMKYDNTPLDDRKDALNRM